MKVIVKLLNGDLFELDINNINNIDKENDSDDILYTIKQIKRNMNEIDPVLFPIKSQRVSPIGDNQFFLLMDYTIKNEDHYGCIIEWYTNDKYTIEFYGMGVNRDIGRNKETDILFFKFNREQNEYKWEEWEEENTNKTVYSSLRELIINLPLTIRIPRTERMLQRIEEYWNNGDYLSFLFDHVSNYKELNPSYDENDRQSNDDLESDKEEYEEYE